MMIRKPMSLRQGQVMRFKKRNPEVNICQFKIYFLHNNINLYRNILDLQYVSCNVQDNFYMSCNSRNITNK